MKVAPLLLLFVVYAFTAKAQDADLSAYNILYWEGEITIIDFPQVADVSGNPHAEAILRRDVARVCEYFARQGAPSDPLAIADELWRRYTG